MEWYHDVLMSLLLENMVALVIYVFENYQKEKVIIVNDVIVIDGHER